LRFHPTHQERHESGDLFQKLVIACLFSSVTCALPFRLFLKKHGKNKNYYVEASWIIIESIPPNALHVFEQRQAEASLAAKSPFSWETFK